jgi:putative membrane-bound dehydrogenase-like protein
MSRSIRATALLLAIAGAVTASLVFAADPPKKPLKSDTAELPHAQKVPPGPALSPEEAMAKMELPPGFKIECIASEPLIVNPTSFTFDERGRIWITESVEYPRRSEGPGQDRVKILEDTDGDGKLDKATIFKDGLNIPCGIAHGNGGVYITNSPDILFLQDTDGDGKADKSTTILTGFGRADTHELPNSLTWGPDGWLYGMNGVFNPATVKDPASDKVYKFTCAIWRYHPPTKRFELFAEGTSNPWGLDYNRAGEWFISACVIDHLWHMTQSGYYHRQGGAYPPNAQQAKLQSITTEKHQQAAYAGLCIYDADAFPAEYRGRFIMGNLHGSALNMDQVTPHGSTYQQKNFHGPNTDPLSDGVGNLDFLQAHDAWFMPVSQKIGPDGCLYIMDWYDRYHCYQDANRDSPGIDRSKGRIYRISYNGTPRAKPFDLTKATDDELLKALEHPNVWWRRTAQRLLNERHDLRTAAGAMAAGPPADPAQIHTPAKTVTRKLFQMAFDPSLPNNANMHALWLLIGQNAYGGTINGQVLLHKALSNPDERVRSWGVRAAGTADEMSVEIYEKLLSMAASESSPSIRVQIPVAAGRFPGPGKRIQHPNAKLDTGDPLPLLLATLKNPANAKDPTIPSITFMNLRPLAEKRGGDILAGLSASPEIEKNFGDTTVKWIKQTIASSGAGAAAIIADVSKNVKTTTTPGKAAQAFDTLIDGLANLPIADRAKAIDPDLRSRILSFLDNKDTAAAAQAATIGLWWQDPNAIEAARKIVADPHAAIEPRVALLRTLAESKVAGNTEAFAAMAGDNAVPLRLRQAAIDALGAIGRAESAAAIVKLYPSLPAELKAGALNALTRTTTSASALLDAVEKKTIAVNDVTANHARSIAAMNNKDLTARLGKAWGTVKTDRDPERVKIVEKFRKIVESGKGDALAGVKVFEKTCVQCHTIYGKGGQVGPDLTGAGRENLDAVLTNVLDPNLVIGAPYMVNVAKTKDGDVISGLLVEQSDTQVVLKDQTKTTTIPRSQLEKLTVQNISMMPEGLETQMTEQEFRDLVAFLLTREPPK